MRPLPTPHALRQLLAAAGLSGPAAEPRRIDEGGEHASWWVGEDHVLRLARDRAGAARQRRESALRDLLRARLSVAVPASVGRGEWAPGLTFTLDTRLPGTSAEARPLSRAGEADLAALLAGLRAVDPADAAALGLPYQPPRPLAQPWRAAVAVAERLLNDGEFTPDQYAALVTEAAPATPAARPPAPRHSAPPTSADRDERTPDVAGSTTAPEPVACLCHLDIKGEHLLVSDDGRVTGVLDWTDAAIGDPAEDIAGLAIAVGAPTAARAAERAGHGPAVRRRGLLLARYDTLVRLADRLYGDDDSPLPLLRAQRDRAWRATP
ncbi:aminoglycoside phosphotransferase family protein [Streptomyces sp. AC563]|uniref:aminoglycoside phosphotransferase family protein n=1 Tax=Streptomyces buecherae TaxID=2763006 RepID=UPI00164DCB4A|nr:aminoglycoside phosphotransferase family protein [Streptomyces buecherae]MBC3988430.1 aminoglycoside phosphotransferase family protein [Streptomyces buecherae]